MLAVDALSKRAVFQSADLMEFTGLNRDAYQGWFKRGLPRNPAIGRPGYRRAFTLRDAATMAVARHVGQQAMGRAIESSLVLGEFITECSVNFWLAHGQEVDEVTGATEPNPVFALRSAIEQVLSGTPESVEFLVHTTHMTKLASPLATLGDVMLSAKVPYFVALDMRTPLAQHFFPIATRLLERVAEADKSEVSQLKEMYSR